jgi:hypothetical protein
MIKIILMMIIIIIINKCSQAAKVKLPYTIQVLNKPKQNSRRLGTFFPME